MNPILAWLGWPEITGIFILMLVLFAIVMSRNLPKIARGIAAEIDNLRKTFEESGSDDEKQSGIVYETLTHDNRTAEFVHPDKFDIGPIATVILFIAQGFGVGRIPFAPGTFGSLVGLLWFALLLWPGDFWIYLAGTMAGIPLSVWFCGAAERILKQTDPPSVVLDEIVAVPLCFVAWTGTFVSRTGEMPVPESFLSGGAWLGVMGVFAAFRLFDVVKPWPVRQSQKLTGGWGVTMDDVLAAAYVNAATLILGLMNR